MDIFGVARSEIAHSNMLGWILDPNESHGLGLFPARKLLHLIAMAKLELAANEELLKRSDAEDQALIDMVLTDGCKIKEASVELEKQVDTTDDGHNDGRIDILVEIELEDKSNPGKVKTLPVVIENKVGTGEHDNQTESYARWARKEFGKDGYYHPLFVFLTPEPTLVLNRPGGKIMPCACKDYVRVNYQYIVDHLIEPCLKQDVADDTKQVLRDYLRALTHVYIKDDNKEGDYCMAQGEEERRLLSQLWKNNQQLLAALIKGIANDPDADLSDEQRESANKFGDTMSRRDFTKYRVEDGEERLAKNRMVLAVVAEYCRRHLDVTYSGLRKLFPDNLEGSFGVVRTPNDWSKGITDPSRHYFCKEGEKITLSDNTEVVVSSEWDKQHIEMFLPVADQLGIKVTAV